MKQALSTCRNRFSTADKQTMQTLQLGILVTLAYVLKLYLFDRVAVNGDTGLYLYDAKQITWGKDIFIDFPSRSPVMEYLLAGVVSVAESPLIGARTFMIIVSLAVGVLVYRVTKQITDHRTGLVAAALWYFTPLSLVWSMWVKTEPVAGLVLLSGVTVTLWASDREGVQPAALLTIGAIFAVAFLIRRVAIVHIGAWGLWWLWYRRRSGAGWRQLSVGVSVAAMGCVGVLFLAYAALADFQPALTVDIIRTHAIALIESSGQGSLGWVGLEDHTSRLADTRNSFFSEICQKCGARTFDIFSQTWTVTLPVSLPLLVAMRSFVRKQTPFLGETVLPTALITTSGFGAVRALQFGDVAMALAAVTMAAAVATIWLAEPVEWRVFQKPALVLPLLILIGLAAGYLYRDRILYVTYFQDFMPWVSILSAVAIVRVYDGDRTRRGAVAGLAAVLVVAGCVGMLVAFPYQPDGVDDNEWMTVEKVQQYGDFMDSELDDGERLLTAQPLYVIESDHRLVADFSRKFYSYRLFPNSNKADQTEQQLIRDIEAGNAPLAVSDANMLEVTNASTAIESHLNDCYEPASNDAINATGGQLLRYTGCES